MITHTIIAKNTTSGTITFPDLGGFYVVASGTEIISDYFKSNYIESSIDLADKIQSGEIVINDGGKDLTAQQGLYHTKDLSFQKIMEYLAGLTVLGLADTPDIYSNARYLRSTPTGFEWIPIEMPEEFEEGNYLRSTVSGTEWGDIPQSGIGTIKHYQFDFYHDESHPHAIVEGAVYSILTEMIFLGTNVTPVTTIKLALSGESSKDEADGSMQIYDLTNNNEILEFGWSGLWENEWEIITVSGMSNLPVGEAVLELRTKSTNGKKSYLTNMFIY